MELAGIAPDINPQVSLRCPILRGTISIVQAASDDKEIRPNVCKSIVRQSFDASAPLALDIDPTTNQKPPYSRTLQLVLKRCPKRIRTHYWLRREVEMPRSLPSLASIPALTALRPARLSALRGAVGTATSTRRHYHDLLVVIVPHLEQVKTCCILKVLPSTGIISSSAFEAARGSPRQPEPRCLAALDQPSADRSKPWWQSRSGLNICPSGNWPSRSSPDPPKLCLARKQGHWRRSVAPIRLGCFAHKHPGPRLIGVAWCA
jgi:hypothetical protein